MNGSDDDRTRWQSLFESHVRARLPERIRHALTDSGSFVEPERVPHLVTLVRGALICSDEIGSTDLSELVQLTFDTLLTVGAQPGFNEYEEFFRDALRLIDVLEQREVPVSRLLLSAARFYAGLANGDRQRRRYIERAVETSQGPTERIPALLTLAKFRIDVSDYRSARHVLVECEKFLHLGLNPEFWPDFKTTTGLAYYYTDPETARRHFQEAIRLGRGDTDEPVIGQAVATATHFLGRLASDSGEYQLAIELYTEAETFSDNYLTGHGFYHQRIAEILVDHGSPEETRYHLERGSETFARVRQVSSGLALIDGIWARWYVRQGEPAKAEELLHAAIKRSREHTAPRAELVLLVELIRLRIRNRLIFSVILLALRASWFYIRNEASGGPRQLLKQIKAAVRLAGKILRLKPRGSEIISEVTPISCPCGAAHAN